MQSGMKPFEGPFFLSFLVACAWTILVVRGEGRLRQVAGLIGVWVSTAVLAALWRAEAVPWLWTFASLVLLAWLGSIVLLATSAVATWFHGDPARGYLVCFASVGLLVHLAAGLQFLWAAVLGPGGV